MDSGNPYEYSSMDSGNPSSHDHIQVSLMDLQTIYRTRVSAGGCSRRAILNYYNRVIYI